MKPLFEEGREKGAIARWYGWDGALAARSARRPPLDDEPAAGTRCSYHLGRVQRLRLLLTHGGVDSFAWPTGGLSRQVWDDQ